MEAPKDMTEFIERVKEEVSLADIAGSRLRLIPAGAHKFKALSPFKTEKTPSFFIDDNPENRVWYCQSTKRGGGVLHFLMEVEGMSRAEAVRYISINYNIPLPKNKNEKPEDAEKADFKVQLYACNKEAQEFFRSYKDKALEYVLSKGYPDLIIDRYEIGFAPDDWNELKNHLISAGFSMEVMKAAGMVGERNNRTFSRFVNRVMFPIKDTYGQIIGFTGRDITDTSNAKYLHSPNSPIFRRENVVWNYSNARKTIHEQKRVFVGEGTFDAIMPDINGFPAVCTLGADISDTQLKILAGSVENIYTVFDPDLAGKGGMVGLFKKVEDSGYDVVIFNVNIVRSKDVKDVADFIKVNGVEAFQRQVDAALPDTAVVVQFLREKHYDERSPNSAISRRVLEEIAPYITKIRMSYRSMDLIERTAQILNISRQDLERWFDKDPKFTHNSSVYNKIKEITFPAPIYERRIMTECLKEPSNWFKFKAMGINYTDFEYLPSRVLEIIDTSVPNQIMMNLKSKLEPDDYEKVMTAYTQSFTENLELNTLGGIMVSHVKGKRGNNRQSDILGRPLRKSKKEAISSLSKLTNQKR